MDIKNILKKIKEILKHDYIDIYSVAISELDFFEKNGKYKMHYENPEPKRLLCIKSGEYMIDIKNGKRYPIAGKEKKVSKAERNALIGRKFALFYFKENKYNNDEYIQRRAKCMLAFEVSKVIDFPMDIREEYNKNFDGESKVIEFKKLR